MFKKTLILSLIISSSAFALDYSSDFKYADSKYPVKLSNKLPDYDKPIGLNNVVYLEESKNSQSPIQVSSKSEQILPDNIPLPPKKLPKTNYKNIPLPPKITLPTLPMLNVTECEYKISGTILGFDVNSEFKTNRFNNGEIYRYIKEDKENATYISIYATTENLYIMHASKSKELKVEEHNQILLPLESELDSNKAEDTEKELIKNNMHLKVKLTKCVKY